MSRFLKFGHRQVNASLRDYTPFKKLDTFKADPRWAPFTALRYKELGLLISVREVGLPLSLRLTDSVRHRR